MLQPGDDLTWVFKEYPAVPLHSEACQQEHGVLEMLDPEFPLCLSEALSATLHNRGKIWKGSHSGVPKLNVALLSGQPQSRIPILKIQKCCNK